MTIQPIIPSCISEQGGLRSVGFIVLVSTCPNPVQIEALLSLADRPTVTRNRRHDTGQVAFTREGTEVLATVLGAVRDIEDVGLHPLRVLHTDCSTMSEIAVRIGRSREAVRRWAEGRAGPGGFPVALNVGAKTAFYSWAEVSRWLRERLGMDTDDADTGIMLADLAVRMKSLSPRRETTPISCKSTKDKTQ